MSKLVKFNFQYPLIVIEEVKRIVEIAFANPREIAIESPWTVVAGFLGTLAPLLLPTYNPIIFSIAITIFLVGIIFEANKYKIYTEDALPIPIVIKIANSAISLDALNSLFKLIEAEPKYRNYRQNLNKYLSITESELVYEYQGDIFDTEHLKDFLKITKHDLEQVKRKTPQNSIFYLAYIGPASVAFLVGSMLAREGMQLFQRSQDNNSYQCVMNVKDRALKEDTPQLEKFAVTYQCSEPRHDKVTIAIDTAAHKTKLNDPSITNYGDIIALQNQRGNTISYEEDWTQYCREIFKVLNEAQQNYKEIKLVYSMPVSLAIAVGMTMQHFWNVQLTNYDPKMGTYQDLIKMNEIIYRV
jgi:hypothetical protein